MSANTTLLVSTKTDTTARKTIVIVGCIIYFILGIVVFSITSGETYGYILGGLCVFYAIFNLFLGLSNLRSYCDVYEDSVVGCTTIGLTTPVQNFEIDYGEIMNVTQSGKGLQIYTQYTTYKVVALANAEQAVSEIRARMKGSK